MSNMSYCRFENTSRDLRDCSDTVRDAADERLKTYAEFTKALSSDYERQAFEDLYDECKRFVELVDRLDLNTEADATIQARTTPADKTSPIDQDRNKIEKEPFARRGDGVKRLMELGYTVKYAPDGESGDHGVGSRVYYKKPDAMLNEYGMPITDHATVSKVGREWFISIF